MNAENYKEDFIRFARELGVIKFGEFTLKSGRVSPYFFNSGLFSSGKSLSDLGSFYAKAFHESCIDCDVFFGPAYKGIPLVSTLSIAYSTLYNEDVSYCFNRKEAKDHGEKGVLVGASIENQSVVIIDDVISAGTSVRESVEVIDNAGGNVKAVLVALDRQEKGSKNERSSIQEIEQEFGIPVISVITFSDLMHSIASEPDLSSKMKKYRSEYGV